MQDASNTYSQFFNKPWDQRVLQDDYCFDRFSSARATIAARIKGDKEARGPAIFINGCYSNVSHKYTQSPMIESHLQ